MAPGLTGLAQGPRLSVRFSRQRTALSQKPLAAALRAAATKKEGRAKTALPSF